MKTYEEMAQSALERIEKEQASQRKRRKAVKTAVLPAVALCLLAAVGIGLWQRGVGPDTVPADKPDATSNKTLVALFADSEEKQDGTATDQEAGGSVKTAAAGLKTTATQGTDGNGVSEVLADLWISDKWYLQRPEEKAEDYVKGRWLGNAGDYKGYYRDFTGAPSGDVYVCADEETVLLVFLDNGSSVVLKETVWEEHP